MQQLTVSEMNNHEQLLQLASNYTVSQCLLATAQLGIADYLFNAPKTCAELAMLTHTHADALQRLLNILMVLGLLKKDAQDYFTLLPAGECLANQAAHSIRHILIMYATDYHIWGDLLYSLQTGESAFEHLHQQPLYDYVKHKPELGAIFDQAMLELSALADQQILHAYDFSRFKCVVDVGGGSGHFLTSLLRQQTHLQGILFDLPIVVERAQHQLQKDPVFSRCQCMGGSFFEQVPSGGDLYVIRNVLNDWNDEKAGEILKNCRAAMNHAGRLLIILRLYADRNISLATHLLQLNRLLIRSVSGGIMRTLENIQQLCQAADFDCSAPLETQSFTEMVIIEARPVSS